MSEHPSNERVHELLRRYSERIDRKSRLQEEGSVPKKKLPGFYSGIAGTHMKIGVLYYHIGNHDKCQSELSSSTEYFLKSATENDLVVLSSLAYTKGLYTAALAGEFEQIEFLANTVQEVQQKHTIKPTDSYADRFYVASCLAGSCLNELSERELNHLKTINQSKPEKDALYGQSILNFAIGTQNGNRDQIIRGIEAMLDYHQYDLNDDAIIDQIMCLEATALLIIARWKENDICVESPYIPEQLVDAATSRE